jgi:serine/threonine protein kinase
MIKNGISTAVVINIGISLLKIIEKVHDKGYCHSDIKPDNILVKMGDESGTGNQQKLVLIDFGEATNYIYDQN